jgi:hypothetical protein
MDVLENNHGVKEAFLDSAIKDLYIMSLNLIEYINNEM